MGGKCIIRNATTPSTAATNKIRVSSSAENMDEEIH
jgi:hypothetical protein